MTSSSTVLIMAAGTGGHVYPALSIAHVLLKSSARVEWLGTPTGMENDLLAGTEIPLHQIKVSGVRGSGIKRKVLAPFMILSAVIQSLAVLRKIKPDCVLGMGGFVCGPAGMAAKMLRLPLVIHEQNAVAGLTNRWLSKLADSVLEAFPGTFDKAENVRLAGNPLRHEIIKLHSLSKPINENLKLSILILGGSQGAAAINQIIPGVISAIGVDSVSILHQTGKGKVDEALNNYSEHGLQTSSEIRVVPFVSDMAAAYDWADLVICRSGASTVSEVAAVGKPSILIPYPYHKDNQQTLNAMWLVNSGAAKLMPQDKLTVDSLASQISSLMSNRQSMQMMGDKAKKLAICNAAEIVAQECLEFSNAKK